MKMIFEMLGNGCAIYIFTFNLVIFMGFKKIWWYNI